MAQNSNRICHVKLPTDPCALSPVIVCLLAPGETMVAIAIKSARRGNGGRCTDSSGLQLSSAQHIARQRCLVHREGNNRN
jgi:hypothetical protein